MRNKKQPRQINCVNWSKGLWKTVLFLVFFFFVFVFFQATVFIWNYAQRSVHAELNLHKVKVESLAFSPNDKYLVSLGGQDDDRYSRHLILPDFMLCNWIDSMSICVLSIVVWDIETKQAICWSTASSRIAGPCLVVQYSNTNDNIFVSAGRWVNHLSSFIYDSFTFTCVVFF